MPAKIHKLQEQSKNDERQKISDIFTGVSIFVNGYTSKSLKVYTQFHFDYFV